MSSNAEAGSLPTEMSDERWEALVERLSDLSVRKSYDAYLDVPWDEHPVDPTDSRWELKPQLDPLARTEWYQSLPPDTRARLGLHTVVSKAKLGLQFELILMRGLLNYAERLPNGSVEFRYALHEVIEEGQHTLMFQELVNRSGIDVHGLGFWERLTSPVITSWGRLFPELFMFFVLGGEDPIDHVQRRALKAEESHPLLQVVMRNHVTEEARHLSFARSFLKRRVPQMSAPKRAFLSVVVPRVLNEMSKAMLRPAPSIVREYDMPNEVVRQAYVDDPESVVERRRAVRKVRRLSREVGLMNPVSIRLWKAAGLWDDDVADDADKS